MFARRLFSAWLAWACLATVGLGQPPITPTPGYHHDRFVTLPSDHVVEFQAYLASFDTDDDDGSGGVSRGVPEFVAYELRAGDSVGPASKPSKWRAVPGLPAGTDSPTDDSYRGSGYSRGHMCMRDHAHRLGPAANYHTFNVINGCPQKQDFNGGHWLGLENLTGKWADLYGTVWIVCGPVFNEPAPSRWIGDDDEVPVAIPDGFFKIVVRESSSSDRPLALAFYYDHDPDLGDSSANIDHSEFLVNIDWLEEQTGLDFLSGLPDEIEDAIEEEAASELWELELAPAFAPRMAAAPRIPEAARAAGIPDYLNGTAAFIPDGDTVHIQRDGKTFKIRLHAVDCPESDQSFGDVARVFTRDLIAGKQVTVRVHDKDMYGRYVGEVFIDGRSLNRELAREGLAWWYDRYAKGDEDVSRLEKKARQARAGLWSEGDPIPPWKWRAQQLARSAPASPIPLRGRPPQAAERGRPRSRRGELMQTQLESLKRQIELLEALIAEEP